MTWCEQCLYFQQGKRHIPETIDMFGIYRYTLPILLYWSTSNFHCVLCYKFVPVCEAYF